MKKRTMFLWVSILLFIPLCYTVLATAAIRLTGMRIVKKLPHKGIALTFDDGPNPVYTGQLLDLLKDYSIPATFFVVGEHARKNPDLIKRMHKEGHQIGIHHLQHTSSWLLTPWRLEEQLVETEKIIQAITGERPVLYRPPWGFLNASSLPLARKHGYRIILWSKHFKDWKVESCETRLLPGLLDTPEDGSILLLHDDGTNPGADDEAPAAMLQKLAVYLGRAKRNGVTFIVPNKID